MDMTFRRCVDQNWHISCMPHEKLSSHGVTIQQLIGWINQCCQARVTTDIVGIFEPDYMFAFEHESDYLLFTLKWT